MYVHTNTSTGSLSLRSTFMRILNARIMCNKISLIFYSVISLDVYKISILHRR